MIVLGIAFGLILGLLARGRLTRLIDVNLRWVGLIFVALALRIGTQLVRVGTRFGRRDPL